MRYIIASHAKPNDLVVKQVTKITTAHAGNVFDYKGLGTYLPKGAIEVAVQIVDAPVRYASSPLAKALAGVTSDQQICRWERPNFSDVHTPIICFRKIRFVKFLRIGSDIIREYDLKTRFIQPII